ncbi:cytochrome d ubiquinol oxidase subunit II [Thalassomonas sp. RHCl1]|uniref:cytochrome d ubiquinol oxidase subunit II n=1 Tax=Thalassomonas sp. RHCl1 TaxID=2995320 RepID=UPI00248BB9D2|nr:cytochrome d ubiquinol oxidase subunit II [Thalassomonas sp. RHCl1]
MPLIDNDWLPLAFVILMALSFLIYAVLDGYDLGVGVLLPMQDQQQRDTMISSIGPFWDANETWLVLAIGLLLIAFPQAHSLVLQHLYLPVSFMLLGLILRGVAFDFRTKAASKNKKSWDLAFKGGSLLATLMQGYMLGRYVMGFSDTSASYAFAVLSAICVTAGYCYIGSAWLVMKTTGKLQQKAASWCFYSALLTALGIIAVCLTNLLLSPEIFDKWLGLPQLFIFLPLPLLFMIIFSVSCFYLKKVPHAGDNGCWLPFAGAVLVFILCFSGLAYSYFPYIIWQELTIWQAASARESLQFIFYGAVVVLPTIVAYTIFSYKVFWGKASKLNYY